MKYDLIVIGGGPAGYNAAQRAGEAGLKVLCVEKRAVGGVCLNEGCIPTKTLLYSAKIMDGVRNGAKYGVSASELSLDHAKVVARKNKVVKGLVSGVKAALKAAKVDLVEAKAEIIGKGAEGYRVQVGEQEHTAAKLLIATGSVPAVPPIPGLQEGLASGFVLTNREILDLEARPDKLAVIGGGVIGLEMASYFNSIGSEVTVIEMMDHIAGQNDRECTALLQKEYEKRGVKFLLSTRVTGVSDNGVQYESAQGEGTVQVDKVLLSIGRRANTEGLGLASIGVLCERGAIVTDEHMRTNQPGVYAAGDVNGRSMLAHTALREGEVAVNHMLGKHDIMRYSAIPGVLYTNPEFAGIGETEDTAKAKGMDVAVVKLPMGYSGRYQAENEGGNGIFKLVVNKKYKTIVGAQSLCNYASEFIVAIGSLIEMELPVQQAREIVFPHPTVGEILREALFKIQ